MIDKFKSQDINSYIIIKIKNTNSKIIGDSTYQYTKPSITIKNYNGDAYKVRFEWSSAITNCNGLFYDCSEITEIDFSHFDTSQVTDMSYMIYDCDSLTIINVSSFKTSNVETMSHMFYRSDSFSSLDLSNFDTSKVTNMDNMFDDCDNIISLDLSNFDTSNVIIMDYMFEECIKLKGIKGLNKLKTNKVESMNGMFQEC